MGLPPPIPARPPSYPPIPPGPPITPRSKRGMLAWWGIIPTAAFIVLQITFGWSEAKVRASSAEFAISYLLGGVIGGPLISFLIALIVYFASRRSQLVA